MPLLSSPRCRRPPGLPAAALAGALLMGGAVGPAACRQTTPMTTEGPPATPRRPVTEVIHDVQFTDPYRWLEDWDDPAVRSWTAAQNRYARSVLDRLPHVAEIRARLTALVAAPSRSWTNVTWRPGALFALEFQPPRQQAFLVTMAPGADPAGERIVVDPNVLDSSGGTAIDFYAVSRDGRKVAVSLSKGGTENGDVHVYDVATSQALPDVVPRVNGGTAGGSVAWAPDGRGFYYTRYPREGERPAADLDFYQQVCFHTLGTPAASDTYELGRDLPRIAEIQLQASEDGRAILASVANGDGGEFAQYLRVADGTWQQLSTFADQVVLARFGRDGDLYLLSRKGAPRGQILRVPLSRPRLAAAVIVVPEGDPAIQGFQPGESRLYVLDMVGGPSAIRAVDLASGRQVALPVPAVSSVNQLVVTQGDELLFRRQSYVDPPAWYRYRPDAGITDTPLRTTSPADFSGIEVVRNAATSRDGTRVPLTILRQKRPARGPAPAILYGYGGFSISMVPAFDPGRLVWLEQGGVYAVANLRGGSEFGEAWHRAGSLTHKQNVFDDFIACAERLIEAGYTTPAQLGIEGGSNGGLLMGAVLTQRPDLFRAVVSHVGIYDMMRFEHFPNGVFNVPEYGSIADPAQFKALLAYSPYQHVVDGTRYPAVLLMSGTNDPRVNPADSRKMAARLQAATVSGLPVLLRVSGGGHGISSSLDERIGQEVDAYAFFAAELGVEYHPVDAGP